MASNKFTISLQGPEYEKDVLYFNHFVDLLHTIQNGLSHLNRLILKTKESTLNYKISDLRRRNPFVIEFLTESKKDTKDVSQEVIQAFIDGFNAIENNLRPPEFFDFEMFEIVKRVGYMRKKYFSEITISNTHQNIIITKDLERYVDNLLGSDKEIYGSIKGMLELVNIHNQANKIYIYPTIGAKRVECIFPINLFEKIKEGIGRYVNVRGKLKYKGIQPFPYSVNINDIEIYPPEKELPSLDDLKGIAPNMTGDLTTEEFIRSIREEDE